jgi:precorrin-2 dehydrogenase/sirohydrochlorin ferrochelatase
MLPIVLDLARFGVLLVGDNPAAARRLRLLDEAGAGDLRVFAARPDAALVAAAGPRLARRLPETAEIAAARLLFLSDRTAPYVASMVAAARAAGALLHVEDDPLRSDLTMPAVLRRGDLAVAVSTGGASPALAAGLRDALADFIGPEWRERTAEIARLRQSWRRDGADAAIVNRLTADWLDHQPRLCPAAPPASIDHLSKRGGRA